MRWIAVFCIFIIVGVAAAFYWRVPLANAALELGLDRAGIHGANATVTDLSISHIHFAQIRVGDAIEAKNINLAIDLSRLPGSPVRRITIDTVNADIAKARQALAKQTPDDPGHAQPPPTLRYLLGQAAELPDIAVKRISLHHRHADKTASVTGSLAATQRRDTAYELRFAIELSGDVDGQVRRASLDGTAGIGAQTAMVDIDARMADSGLLGTLKVQGDISADTAAFNGKMHLEMAEIDKLAELVPGLAGTGGKVALDAQTSSPLAFGLDTPLGVATLTDALKKAGGDGIRVDGQIEDGSHGNLFRGVNGTVAAVLQGLAGATDRLQADGTLSLRAGRAGTADITVKNASLSGAFRLMRKDTTLALNFPDGLRAAAAEILSSDGAVSAAPMKLALTTERAHIKTSDEGSSRRAEWDLGVKVEATRLTLAAKPDAKIIDISPMALRLTGTTDHQNNMDLRIKAPRISATEKTRAGVVDGLDISVRQFLSGVTAKLRGRLSALDTGKPLLLPTPLEADLSLKQQIVRFDVKAVLPGANAATARGRHALSTGRGSVALKLPGFRMTQGGGELQALAPSISSVMPGIDIQSGTLRADAALTWNRKSIDGTGNVAIENLNFADTSSGTSVQGLSADIRLDRLVPPRTPAGQTVRIQRIGAGVALNDLLLRFALIDGTSAAVPAIRIDTFRTGFAGGTLGIAPTVLDAEAAARRATINVENVDLAALLSAIGLENISGTGRLSGVIPIVIAGDAVGIPGGRLAAAEPGILRIRSEAAKKALAQGGVQVTLMLSALEDFRYETLTLEIEKETAGEGRVILRTRGQNPAVRDGQPFVINLTLTGNVDGLAAILAQALQLPGGIVRTMLAR